MLISIDLNKICLIVLHFVPFNMFYQVEIYTLVNFNDVSICLSSYANNTQI